jgi:hypothetical protein
MRVILTIENRQYKYPHLAILGHCRRPLQLARLEGWPASFTPPLHIFFLKKETINF